MYRKFASLIEMASAVVAVVVVAQLATPTTAKAQAIFAEPITYYDEPGSTLAWGQYVSELFKNKVFEICQSLGCNPDHLMATMAFETGATFSPSIKNRAGSGGVGLIQFMPRTAKGLGTSTAKLATMSAVNQLDFVEKHLKPMAGKLKLLSDVYMSVLLPSKVGKPDHTILFKRPSRAYRQNKGLDLDRSGTITKREASSKVAKLLEESANAESPTQNDSIEFGPLLGVL